jgi:hypothetical protein
MHPTHSTRHTFGPYCPSRAIQTENRIQSRRKFRTDFVQACKACLPPFGLVLAAASFGSMAVASWM